MESNRTYTHNGIKYVTDWYTNETITLREHNAKMESWLAGRQSAHVAAKPDAKLEAKLEKTAKQVSARAATKAALDTTARELAKTLTVDIHSYTNWRIANGYLWQSVSPKGVVYTETIKTLEITDPLYVTGTALKIAVANWIFSK